MAKYQEILDAINKLDGGFTRLDERSINTWRSIEDIKGLLEKQNGRIRRNSKFIYIILGALSASGIGFGVVNFVG